MGQSNALYWNQLRLEPPKGAGRVAYSRGSMLLTCPQRGKEQEHYLPLHLVASTQQISPEQCNMKPAYSAAALGNTSGVTLDKHLSCRFG